MSRLVVVSNRCALPRSTMRAPGGLAVALTGALEKTGGMWFGWSGRIEERQPLRAELQSHDNVTYATIPLLKADYDTYYKGFSNRVLWPMLHYRIDAMEFETEFLNGYIRTNAYFTRRLRDLLQEDDVIWVHDYHLIPIGLNLRMTGATQPIGFFLHVPFPPYDVIRTIPSWRDMLEQLCAYDVVGFQTENDTRNFIDAAVRGVGAAQTERGLLTFGSHNVIADTFPISINIEEVQGAVSRGRNSRALVRLKQSLRDRQLIIGVDRLDYSKGLPERFAAYEWMLKTYPSMLQHTVFLQIAQPSRQDVPEYDELRRHLESLTGRINSQFAEFDWMPLRYIVKGYARPTVLGFLSLARTALVTPLRDGMNLVAKEFIAAQGAEDPGVLILSDFTGAARELDGGALIVNPFDRQNVGNALARSFSMDLDERRERWQTCLDAIRRNDIVHWCDRYLKTLQSVAVH